MTAIITADQVLTFATSLAKKHTNEIGFLPIFRYQHARAAGRLRPQYLNNEPCGFLLHGPLRPNRPCHVWQTCIQVDARRLAAATQLINELEIDASAADCSCILLRCAADLAANEFWKAYGFSRLRTLHPDNKRRRPVNVYSLPLVPDRQFLLFPTRTFS